MSRFSGKCDLYDNFSMIRDFDLNYIKRCKIYIGYSLEKRKDGSVHFVPGEQLHIETMKDIVPYYPYIITMMYGDKDGQVIFLSEKSWPDMEMERAKKSGRDYRMYSFYKEELEKEMKKYEDEYNE